MLLYPKPIIVLLYVLNVLSYRFWHWDCFCFATLPPPVGGGLLPWHCRPLPIMLPEMLTPPVFLFACILPETWFPTRLTKPTCSSNCMSPVTLENSMSTATTSGLPTSGPPLRTCTLLLMFDVLILMLLGLSPWMPPVTWQLYVHQLLQLLILV